MLGSLYLAPVHAACIANEGSGVLLCGDSGAGKTSLAYACATRGWTYVADDAVYMVRNGSGRRILGRPHSIRFRAAAADLFPELASYAPVIRPNGKPDIEAQTSDLGLRSTASEARADFLVFLRRDRASAARLSEYSKRRASEWMEQVLCFGEDHVRVAQKQALNALLELPILELTYSDMADAERRLRTLVRGGL